MTLTILLPVALATTTFALMLPATVIAADVALVIGNQDYAKAAMRRGGAH